MGRIYVFLADGFEEIEGLTVVDLFRRAGKEVCMASINGTKTIHGSHGITLQADALFEECDFSDGELLVLPGGMPGTIHLGEYRPLCDLILSWNAEGKRIAAICAAPTVFGRLGILEGKKAVCYPGMEEQLTGAKVVKAKAVTDGNITTGMGMGAAIAFALELIGLLCGQTKAQELKKSIVYGHLSEL